MRPVYCAKCLGPATIPESLELPAADPDRWFATEVPPEYAAVNKNRIIYRRALEEAAKDRGSLRDPRIRLKALWARDRETLKKTLPPAAQREFFSLTELEKIDRHREDTWIYPECRRLHTALTQLKVWSSEAGAIVDAWFGDPAFNEHVQMFLDDQMPADHLLREARHWQRARRARR